MSARVPSPCGLTSLLVPEHCAPTTSRVSAPHLSPRAPDPQIPCLSCGSCLESGRRTARRPLHPCPQPAKQAMRPSARLAWTCCPLVRAASPFPSPVLCEWPSAPLASPLWPSPPEPELEALPGDFDVELSASRARLCVHPPPHPPFLCVSSSLIACVVPAPPQRDGWEARCRTRARGGACAL